MRLMETTELTLVPATSPILRQVAKKITDIPTEVAPYLAEMRRIMEEKDGAGLAAPQVGLGLCFFISTIPGHPVVINPIYAPIFGEHSSRLEGCLSFPGRKTFVSRYRSIQLDWTDLEGKARSTVLHDMDARIAQHEVDHLYGTTIFP